MSRQKITLGVNRLVAAIGTTRDEDDAVLDATEALLRRFGLRRWSIEDVADRAGVGRSSIYRRFATRDDLVHAVLARELRRTLAAIGGAVEAVDDLDDKAAAAAAVCVTQLRESLVPQLVESDPSTFLPFLTVQAGPLLALARDAISAGLRSVNPGIDDIAAARLAEVAARLGLSLILTRETVLPLDDPDAAREAMRAIVRPLLIA